MRFGDLFQPPFFGFGADRLVGRVDLRLGPDIEPVVVEKVHLVRLLGKDDSDRVWPAETDQQRDRAGLHDLEAEELLVESARKSEVAAFQCAVRQKIEL